MPWNFQFYLHRETFGVGTDHEGAYRVSEDGDDDEGFWLPKSQVEETDRIEGGEGMLDKIWLLLPDWLAEQHNLI